MPNFYEKFFGGVPSFHNCQPFGQPFCAAGHHKPTTPNYDLRPGADPVFHETIVITVPFGPNIFEKVILSMEDGSFSVLSAFLCDMFYITFVSHVLYYHSKCRAVEPSDV